MEDTRLKTFPFILREKRKEKKLKQKQLADMVGVDRGTVSLWECGKRPPDLDNLLKLSTVLGCTCSDLLGERPSVDAMAAYFGISGDTVVNLMVFSKAVTNTLEETQPIASRTYQLTQDGLVETDRKIETQTLLYTINVNTFDMLLLDDGFMNALNQFVKWRYEDGSHSTTNLNLDEMIARTQLLESNKCYVVNTFRVFLDSLERNITEDIKKSRKGS